MYIRNNGKFGKPIKIINAGDYYVSSKDEFIGTLLGSCVAVCLYDPINKIAGMNHFMLPGKITLNDRNSAQSERYGITAINELLQAMMANGASRENLVSKIFGGGSVLRFEKKVNTIPLDNIRVARIMLEMEDIPILESDVGGEYTRKLLFEVDSGKVFLRKTVGDKILKDVASQLKDMAEKQDEK